MSESKPRLARLSAILTQLQSRSLVTATSLAKKHDVSLRTIYRDIRTLESSGVPITTVDGKGYTLVEGYHIPPIMFSREEALSLLTAEKLIAHSQDASLTRHHQSAMDKVRAVLRGRDLETIELLESRMASMTNISQSKTSDSLLDLQTAILERQIISMQYEPLSRQEITTREVNPKALYQTKGNWVLIAYCHLREAYREFRLDQILHWTEIGRAFDEDGFELMTYFSAVAKKKIYTPDIPLSLMPSILAETKITAMQTKKVEAFKVIGISIRTTNANKQAMNDIPAHWQKWMDIDGPSLIDHKVDDSVLAIYTNYEGDYTEPYDMIIGCRVGSTDSIPDGMVALEVPASSYHLYHAKGDLTQGAVAEAWYKIWEDNIDRRYTCDYEVYDERAQDPTNAKVDIYVSVK